MDNFAAVEKLSKSFIEFVESSNLRKYDYQQMGSLTTTQKLVLIKTYLKPYKNRIDTLILETFQKKGDKLENYKPEEIDKLKKYFEAFIECVD